MISSGCGGGGDVANLTELSPSDAGHIEERDDCVVVRQRLVVE